MSASSAAATFPSISGTGSSRPTIPLSLVSRLFPNPTTESASSSTTLRPVDCPLQPPEDPISIASVALSVAGLILCLAFLLVAVITWRRLCRGTSSRGSPSLPCKTATSEHSDSLGHAFSPAVPTRYHHPSKLQHLVLAAWLLFTLDQLAMLLYLVHLYFMCPQYSCRNKTLASTPGCGAPTFLLAALYLQVIGSAVFVCASINRFMHLYSVLSRTRYILLRLAYLMVAVVLSTRLVALTAHEYVRLDQERWPIGSKLERRMHYFNILTYTISYLIFGVLDLAALVQGLIFIGRVRRGIHQLVMSLPRRRSSVGISVGDVQERRLSLMHGSQGRPADQQARLVMVWIAISISLLLVFATAMTMLPAMLEQVPVLLYNSVMTLLLKLFAAFVSLAISGAGRVIAGAN
ncbi:hypothetical protein BCR44DRAFT_90889 [Catenaria anguillulae PL171]|uniref:Uncharacterized protein n=1 Tax=Catenaria anguillulae PL171 TaxID=765915 RepID=A0A1Y2HJA1_9FUNG|nr:hypothetical protein BCR44DRAFT_90889 [Catenaria anguillulae PL171]